MTDVSIKETQEAFAALTMGAKLTKKIVKGGLPAVPQAVLEAASNTKVFVEGYKGSNLIKAELQNLSKEEIIALVVDVIDSVEEVEQA
jgi:hypothetical protein